MRSSHYKYFCARTASLSQATSSMWAPGWAHPFYFLPTGKMNHNTSTHIFILITASHEQCQHVFTLQVLGFSLLCNWEFWFSATWCCVNCSKCLTATCRLHAKGLNVHTITSSEVNQHVYLKCQEPLNQQHIITSQKNRSLSCLPCNVAWLTT
jgi:hypothetical protein